MDLYKKAENIDDDEDEILNNIFKDRQLQTKKFDGELKDLQEKDRKIKLLSGLLRASETFGNVAAGRKPATSSFYRDLEKSGENEIKQLREDFKTGKARQGDAIKTLLKGKYEGQKRELQDLNKTYKKKQIDMLDKNLVGSKDLRKEWRNSDVTKSTYKTYTNLKKMQKAASADTPSSDMSLVFAFNKLLDSMSVVRESEVRMTINQTIGNFYEKALQAANKGIKGRLLSTKQRKDLLEQAKLLYIGQLEGQRLEDERIRYIAGDNHRNVVNPIWELERKKYANWKPSNLNKKIQKKKQQTEVDLMKSELQKSRERSRQIMNALEAGA